MMKREKLRMFDLNDFLETTETDKFFQGFAFFCDKAGLLEIVFMRYSSVANFHEIISFNEDGEQTGFNMVYVHPDRRLYLSEIYCLRKFRGLGIASALTDLMDHITQKYEGYILRGVRNPYDAMGDITCGTFENKEQLLKRANNFYRARGFTIVKHDEYLSNPSMFPLVDYEKDFLNYEEIPDCILVKRVEQKDNPYKNVDGILVHENALSKLDDIKKFVRKKSFLLKPRKD